MSDLVRRAMRAAEHFKSDERSLLANILRLAAEQFEHDAKNARHDAVPKSARDAVGFDRIAKQFETQATQCRAIAEGIDR